HYKERGMLQEVTLPDGEKLLVPGIVPKLSETPGDIGEIGPKLGEHNEEIYKNYLQLTDEEIENLNKEGIIEHGGSDDCGSEPARRFPKRPEANFHRRQSGAHQKARGSRI